MKKIKKVLIVEDNVSLKLILSKLITAAGYEVTSTISGIEAIALLKNQKFDIIIADYQLPEVTGLDIFQEIQHQPIKKILISAYANLDLDVKAAAFGALFMAKPFNNEELLRLLKK